MTNMLFNFYRVVDISQQVHEVRHLLRLLAPFMQLTSGTGEFGPILETIVNWGQHNDWAKELAAPQEQPLFVPAIQRLKRRSDVRLALLIVNYYEVLFGLRHIFAQLEMTFDEFTQLLAELAEYIDEVPLAERHGHRQTISDNAKAQGFNLEVSHLAELEALCDTDVFRISEMAIRILQVIEQEAHRLRQRDMSRLCADAFRNQRAIADLVRLELYHKLESTPPPLRPDQRYGILLVDVSSPSAQTMMTTAITVMHRLQMRFAKEKRLREIMFVVYRIGRAELVFNGMVGAPKPKQLRLERIWHQAPLIGPVLDHYEPEQVGFVLMLTGESVRDLTDWASDPGWIDRFWVHTTNRSWLLSTHVDGSEVVSQAKKNVNLLTDEIMNKLG
jgi:hypothetical protein